MTTVWPITVARIVPLFRGTPSAQPGSFGENVVVVLQDSPAAGTGAPQAISPVPMGAARLRITSFPNTHPGEGGVRW
jgi:hypothetical protein